MPCPKTDDVRMIADDSNRNSFRVRMGLSNARIFRAGITAGPE
jgi:hypothetical protein